MGGVYNKISFDRGLTECCAANRVTARRMISDEPSNFIVVQFTFATMARNKTE